MHPEICKFPSLHFYDNKLLNGCQTSSKSAPFHQTKGLGPYVFYDITDGREVRGKNSGAMSLCNDQEADAAVELLSFLKKRYNCTFYFSRLSVYSKAIWYQIIDENARQFNLMVSKIKSENGNTLIKLENESAS